MFDVYACDESPDDRWLPILDELNRCLSCKSCVDADADECIVADELLAFDFWIELSGGKLGTLAPGNKLSPDSEPLRDIEGAPT